MFTPFCYVAFLTLLTALILSDYFNFNSFSDLKFHSDLPLFNQFVSALSILNHQTSIDMPRQILTLPAKANETATLIFLHGLGDSGFGFQPFAAQIQTIFPYIRCVLPHAPVQPVTLNGHMLMPSWHDVTTLEKIDSENYKGLEESRQRVHQILEDEIKGGVKSDRIMLGGFSQGAGLSVYAGYQFKQKLAGIVCLSGCLPHFSNFTSMIHESNKATPILIAHGLKDQVVNPLAGQKVRDVLSETKTIDITYKTYPQMQHSTSPEEMADLISFIGKNLPRI